MGSAASSFHEGSSYDLNRVESIFRAAAAAARAAPSAVTAVDTALSIVHDELDGAGTSAFVLEHGRLWPVGVRGYAMIPDGLPLDMGVIGRAVKTSEVQLVVDVAFDRDYVVVLDGVTSEHRDLEKGASTLQDQK